MAWSGQALGRCSMIRAFRARTRAASFTRRRRRVSNCAARQAERFGNSFAAELRLLTVHGVLHLLGYDHATLEEEAEMWALQEEILAPFGDRGLSQRDHDRTA